ncbi:MAG TPA: tetratricopeptide repeat protein [Saprospiraceae bacterium]|nr:tetratricopeptide repeat protein [Saprospiraceae bacterium]
MKNRNLVFIFISIFYSVTLLVLSSCGENKSNDSAVDSSKEIPALLDRNEKIRYGKEWDDVSNNYQTLKLAIQKNENDHEAKIKMANLFIREARVTGEHGHYYPAALAMTDRIINSTTKVNNMEFLALVTKAGVQLSLHEFKGALETGQKAIQLNNKNAQIYGVLTDCYVELGQYDKAVEMADIMISIKPDLRSYARISYLREIHGQIPEAIEAMKMAIEAGVPGYEDTAWAMLTLGELYERYGEPDKAKLLYEEILAERPDYPFAVGALGAIYLKKNDIKQAEAITLKAMDIIPEVGFYTQLAEIYKIQGRTEEMTKIMEEVFVMLKDDEESGHNMNLEYANIYLDILDKPDMALQYAQKEFEKRPDNIDVNRMMARIYNAKSDQEMTQKYKLAASVTNSKHPELEPLMAKI